MGPFVSGGGPGQGGGEGGGAPNLSGPAAARPTASGSGAIYLCTDVPALYLDDPTAKAWIQWAITPAPAGPAASAYTTVGNLALTQLGDVVRARTTSNANAVGNCALIALPTATVWAVTLMADFVGGNYRDQYPELGPVVTNGTVSGVSNGWALANVQTNDDSVGLHGVLIGVGSLARIAVFNEVLAIIAPLVNGDGRLHLRLLNDATLLHMQVSNDGYAWTDWYALPTPAGLTNYGFYIGNNYPSGDAIAAALIYSCNFSVRSQVAITNATNANPIVYTTSTPHGFQTGDWVSVAGVIGNTTANTSAVAVAGYDPAALSGSGTSAAVVNVIDATHFNVAQFTGNAPYISGGIATQVSR